MTPENVVDTVPMLGYIMVKDMSPKQIDDLQKFADFGHEIGVVPEKVDVQKISSSVLNGFAHWMNRPGEAMR